LWSVRGNVVNRENEPVGKFRVSARGSDGGRSTWSNSGSFVLDRVHAGETTVTVGASGYRDAQQHVLVRPSTEPLRFVLERAGIVRGRVLDPEGNPVAGASIAEGEGPRSRGDETETALSGASGCFEIPVSSDDVRLEASRVGFAPSEPLAIRVESGA